jgi:hypothetical protein
LEYCVGLLQLVHDLDDSREAQYVVNYTKKKPLSLAAIEDAPRV